MDNGQLSAGERTSSKTLHMRTVSVPRTVSTSDVPRAHEGRGKI